MYNKELILTLLNINGMGRKTINNLLKENLPKTLECHNILSFINKINKFSFLKIEDIIQSQTKAKSIISYCNKNKIGIITILDKNFPNKLKIIDDNPVLLFYKGNINCLNYTKSIAIVGSRFPSIYGKEYANHISRYFLDKNFIIVSGLACGCDTYAHKICTSSNKRTIAVLPCGINHIYPKSNIDLSKEIILNDGCLVSEYFPNQPPLKYQFIERDRLQSALSIGIAIIECSINSGTMHTVYFGKKQNKLISCCIPNKNISIDKISGNKKILEDKNIIPIYNYDSLNNFYLLLEKNINRNSDSSKYTSHQLKFSL